jgi:dihydroorotase
VSEVFGGVRDPVATFVIIGARVVDPAAGTDEVREMAVVDGRIAEVSAAPSDAERIDGHGLVVAPAFCDLHVHLREPGDAATETIASGARAAAKGGFSTVCAMPNTDPPLDDAERIERVLAAGADAACRVRVIGAATVGRGGERIGDLDAQAAAGAVAWSDDGASVATDELTEAALVAAGRLGRPLIEHAEDAGLTAGGVMRAGATAAALGLTGWDPRAEVAVVERDLAIAARTGARLHLTHLSTAASVEAVRRARGAGIQVTCDVTPHHLALAETWVAGDRAFAWDEPRTDALLAYDAACRVNPPLATREDALALLAAVDDGTIDAIATDHAPHPTPLKLVPFGEAAPGLIGLETALSVGLAAVAAGHLRLGSLLGALGPRPAAIIGETRSLAVGEPADLVCFDPEAHWRVERRTLVSRSANTPLIGLELPGVVRLTVADGRVTYRAE